MDTGYRDRTVVITGASDGIGAELALQLAAQRAKLVLAARNAAALERVAAACRARGAVAHAVPTDVTDDAACARLMVASVDAHGGIDALMANAGVSMHARFTDITDFSTFERLWRINCLGTVQCVRHAYPHLKARRGQIVGVCSLAGKTGVPERTTYCASKFAQAGFLEALRIEAEDDGIAVTVVFPGVVATEIRRHGWNADGRSAGVSGLAEDTAMRVDECARQIIAAMGARRRELVMTRKARAGMWMKLLAPRVVDRMARAALAKDPASRRPVRQ
jgi:short-subunit dehydrogenase